MTVKITKSLGIQALTWIIVLVRTGVVPAEVTKDPETRPGYVA